MEPGGDRELDPEDDDDDEVSVFMFLICLKAGGEMTVGTVGLWNDANPFLSLTE